MTDQRRSELVELLKPLLKPLVQHQNFFTWEEKADAHAERILQALTAAGVDLEGWREIESAPKDGRFVLVAAEETGIQAAQWGAQELGIGRWVVLKSQHYTNYSVHPSHWRPLPTPPKDKP